MADLHPLKQTPKDFLSFGLIELLSFLGIFFLAFFQWHLRYCHRKKTIINLYFCQSSFLFICCSRFAASTLPLSHWSGGAGAQLSDLDRLPARSLINNEIIVFVVVGLLGVKWKDQGIHVESHIDQSPNDTYAARWRSRLIVFFLYKRNYLLTIFITILK